MYFSWFVTPMELLFSCFKHVLDIPFWNRQRVVEKKLISNIGGTNAPKITTANQTQANSV